MANEIKNANFFEGGKAIFTVTNPSGQHYTFKIRKPRPETPYFVSMLTGPDNTSSFTYLGLYNPTLKMDINQNVRLTAKSRMTNDSTPVKVLRWAIKKVAEANSHAPILPTGYSIQHEGRCCRCGRRLTVPESIDSGIGPECAEMMGVAHERLVEVPRDTVPQHPGIRFAPADAIADNGIQAPRVRTTRSAEPIRLSGYPHIRFANVSGEIRTASEDPEVRNAEREIHYTSLQQAEADENTPRWD